MAIGALLSVYILYINRSFFKTKQAIAFWLLVALLGWIVFHLLFLSNNLPLQLREFTSIWKRVGIAMIFALGFGMALSRSQAHKGYWVLFYAGMLMPTLIFLGKYWLNVSAPKYGWAVPEYLRIYADRDSVFYLYKTDYVSFCLPALAVSLAQLKRNLDQGRVFIAANLVYLLSLLAVLTTFFLGNIKNGIAYSSMLIVVFSFLVLNSQFNKVASSRLKGAYLKSWLLKFLMLAMVAMISIPILMRHIDQNPSWQSLWVDSKVAVQVDQNDSWKYWGARGYPLNEYGNPVSATNYERLSWGIVGLRLLKENPLGYGLVQDSFGYLTKRKWPESLLTQSHSGWLDLGLGIGITGLGLILCALLTGIYRAIKNAAKVGEEPNSQGIWSSRVIWILWAVLLLWATSEISLKLHLIALIFWISFAIGLDAPRQAPPSSSK